MASHTKLFINGAWKDSLTGASLPVLNPAPAEPIDTVSDAKHEDLDLALAAQTRG